MWKSDYHIKIHKEEKCRSVYLYKMLLEYKIVLQMEDINAILNLILNTLVVKIK